ncbi:hypothetical protein EXM22_04460 [Oceanispirochaeta crateris]|uniref:Protein BatD n=1 Tax=Oceanispirochaeta crateris TaxID=2518645 RepID=A0A5C1QGP8_9SPIO|nr:hypothetical protein [Oceanispirochaeta crateris]QEN07275.1 hypothetical protein EXM22_04460 [Oceanispirochaeta crateris]
MQNSGPLLFQKMMILLLLFLFSCGENSSETTNENLIVSGKNAHIEWEVSYPDKDLYFTDILPLTLVLKTDEIQEMQLDDSGSAPWGDFRVISKTKTNRLHIDLRLQPRKTGDSLLQIPALSLSGLEEPLVFPPIEFQILSSLDGEDAQPRPLVDVEADDSANKWGLPALLILILCTLGVGFIYRRKHKKGLKKEETPLGFSDFLKEQSPSLPPMEKQLDFYVQSYRYLISDLVKFHPGVHPSDSPSELINHLERPSSVNQWALRSLYPVLEFMDDVFYKKQNEALSQAVYDQHLQVLREWSQYVLELKSEGGFPDDSF